MASGRVFATLCKDEFNDNVYGIGSSDDIKKAFKEAPVR